MCEDQDQPGVFVPCRLKFCGVYRVRFVYGLLDRRNNDIFYVGSTFDLHERFTEHLHKHAYVVGMLERGLFPVPLKLLEFTTRCDSYSRQVERAIAEQLREQGHSAFCDDTAIAWSTFRCHRLAEEQAQQFAFLCELWSAI